MKLQPGLQGFGSFIGLRVLGKNRGVQDPLGSEFYGSDRLWYRTSGGWFCGFLLSPLSLQRCTSTTRPLLIQGSLNRSELTQRILGIYVGDSDIHKQHNLDFEHGDPM